MKISFFFWIVVILLFSTVKTLACVEGMASVVTQDSSTKKTFKVCNDGNDSDPTSYQMVNFFRLGHGVGDSPSSEPQGDKMNMDNFARVITEGEAANIGEFHKALEGHASGNPDHPLELTNEMYSGEFSSSQGLAFERMATVWNKVMLPVSSKKLDIFSFSNFEDIGAANKKTIDALAREGQQCLDPALRLSGYPVRFSDGEVLAILPISIEKKGDNSHYTIRYLRKDFDKRMGPIEERVISMTPTGPKITWFGSDGTPNSIERQIQSELNTKYLFSNSFRMKSSGTGGPLCNAEDEIEILKSDGSPGIGRINPGVNQ